MSDSFFQKKRKRPSSAGGGGGGGGDSARSKAGPSRLRMRDKSSGSGSSSTRKAKGATGDEELGTGVNGAASNGLDDDDDEGGIEGMDLAHRYDEDVLSSDEDKQETPAEARVRLARLYLDSLRDDDVNPDDADAAEADRQNIASRLQADAATHSTHVHTFVAERIQLPSVTNSTEHILACRGQHRLSVTAIVVGADRASFWTASKDGTIIRWRLYDGKMLEVISKGQGSQDVQQGGKSSINRSKTSGSARRRMRAKGRIEGVLLEDAARQNGTPLTNGITDAKCKQIRLDDGQGHTDEVWALAVSSDGRHLASGGKDRRICIWGIERIAQTKGKANGAHANGTSSTRFVKALGGHKDSITALRFRQGSHDLFSASCDRTLKLFDVSQLSYVETFFGHQEDVAGLDLLRGEVAVTAGSRDRTLRWWKVRDESQLVFRGGAKSKVRDILEGGDIADHDDEEGTPARPALHEQRFVEGSIDAVAMIDEHTFLSGGDSGTISLWSLSKKKPIFTVSVAHGFVDVDNGEQTLRQPRWITSLACLPYGDVFASGSWDGTIKLWQLQKSLRSFSHLFDIPAAGFVNALELVLPSRVAMRRLGREVVRPSAWRRRGGLRGGPKKTFSLDGADDDASSSDESESDDEESSGDDGPIDSEETANINTDHSTHANGVNGINAKQEQLIVVAAMGQEPTRGRWQRLKEARNGALVIPLALE